MGEMVVWPIRCVDVITRRDEVEAMCATCGRNIVTMKKRHIEDEEDR